MYLTCRSPRSEQSHDADNIFAFSQPARHFPDALMIVASIAAHSSSIKNFQKMSFLSRLRLKKNDKDPAGSQSRVVEPVQNEETSAKTGTKVCFF